MIKKRYRFERKWRKKEKINNERRKERESKDEKGERLQKD